jgi:predicted nucleic acid-binding protein
MLVDANVLSEATKPKPDQRILDWLRNNQAAIVVDPVIVGELRFGILRLSRGARRKKLEDWFDRGIRLLECVPWDMSAGLRWAQLLVELRSRGRAMPIKHSLIAATALVHGFPLVTLNVRDFESARVEIVDPRE